MTVQATDFNLYDAVRQIIADGVGPNPRDVAAKTLEIIPIGLERDVLALLLPEFCRHLIVKPKLTARQITRSGRATRGKWDAVREDVLKDAWSVDGNWMEFGDLTSAHITWLIADRKQASEDFTTEANRLSNLLSVMKRHKASTVRDVPFDMIEKVMS